jgi:EmrB/QacA subfamily drug resistance transporter
LTPQAAPAEQADRIGREAWLALLIATLVFFLVVVDVSAVNVAFPSIGKDFSVPETKLSWIISGYNVTVAAFLMLAGRLADSLGRKKLFIPGVAVFMIGSMLSGLAPNADFLIAARVIQAIGGAIVSPTAIAVVLPEFPVAKRSMAIGITGATAGLGGVFGPALGSFIIDLWSWRGIFWINVPACLLVLALSPRLLRESKNPAATGKIDLLGVVIGTSAVSLVMFAIVQSETRGITDARVVAMFVLGAVLVPILIRRSARHPEPLIELSLFRKRSFSSTNSALALYSMAFTSGFLVNSLLLQDLWGQSITTTGKALVFSAGSSAVLSPIAGRLADRVGHRWILVAGSLMCASAYLLFQLLLDAEPHVFDRYVPISLLLGIGVGTSISTWSSAGLSDVEPAQFGTANASIRTTQQVFYALGISVVITLLAGHSGLTGFRWAWSWVAGMYLASAVVIGWTFPAGSSAGRGIAT